ncbi:unnamed protein product [Symbiodinium sp. CCMP2592]|nr:unnamed protein product [Symbiodinium sp. CCMP2592]
MPGYFFDYRYLHAWAMASRAMLLAARNKAHWNGLQVNADQPNLEVARRLRSVVDLLTKARTICVNLRQLSMLLSPIPGTVRLHWDTVPLQPHPPLRNLLFGCRSRRPLMGCADFDVFLPATVRGMYIGVREWNGQRRSYCRVDNVFQEGIAWSIGINDFPARPHMSASIRSPVPNATNRLHLKWDQRVFSIALNGVGVARARLQEGEHGDAAPPLSSLFFMIFGQARHRQPLLQFSAVRARPVHTTGMIGRLAATSIRAGKFGIVREELQLLQVLWRIVARVWPKPLPDMVGSVIGSDSPGEPFFRMTANPEADSTDVLESCSTLANLNPHETDARLRFQTEGHAYYIDGEKIVTSLIHEYAAEFDAWQAVQNMKAGKNWPRREYAVSDIQVDVILLKLVDAPGSARERLTEVLQHQPMDIESLCAELARFREELSNWDDIVQEIMLQDNEIVDFWKKKSFHACNAGTWMHSMLEHMMNGSDILPGTMTKELSMAVDFLRELHDEMPGLVAYRSEWTIYAGRENLAGSIDLVLFDTSDEKFVLIDWKRSEKLQQKYNSYGKFMMEPLQDIPDCQGEHYRLQLNIYKWILESYYSKKVKSMKVVCAYPNSCNEAFVDDVPDLTSAVDRLMKHRRAHVQAKRTACDFSQMPETADLAGEEDIDAAMEPAGELPGPSSLQALPETATVVVQDTLLALEEEPQAADQGFPMFMQKRRDMKGANDSAQLFQDMFSTNDSLLQRTLDQEPADALQAPESILQNTRRGVEQLTELHPTWSSELLRLSLVGGYLCQARIGDRPMLADCAGLLWMMEGERHIRVHNGFCYVYDEEGTFLPFGGVPPETVLRRVHAFCTRLEGLLLLIPSRTKRHPANLLNAIAAKRQEFPSDEAFIEQCAANVLKGRSNVDQYQRLDSAAPEDAAEEEQSLQVAQDFGEDGPESWTVSVADRVWKISCALRSELMHTKLISLLVEWCETPDQRQSCLCYQDLCVRYDADPDTAVKIVPKASSNDCYIKIPHALKDPVLEDNVQRVRKFYSQTFWCNFDVFRCCMAAAALAKRGLNIDRCFIGISPGGVGQSLYSLHLAAMFGSNHAFFDPNVWHNDEELRKQVEALWIHHANVFDLRKRLELNRMMMFAGVNIGNFNSILRRALVWKAKARFLPAQYLRNHPDHEKAGIFVADPSLSKFLSSPQASIAGLRLQHAFELQFNKEQCYQLIEDYVSSGDEYLTEDTMRTACSLPIRQKADDIDAGVGNLLAGSNSQEERDQGKAEWDNLTNAITQKMLETQVDTLSFYEFKTMVFSCSIPNLPKTSLWDELQNKNFMMKGMLKTTKTNKERPGGLLPLIRFKKPLDTIVDVCRSNRLVFQELHNVASLAEYMNKFPARASNVSVIINYLKQALGQKKAKGRPGVSAKTEKSGLEKKLQKMKEYEAALEYYMNLPQAAKRRRVTGKTESVPESVPEGPGFHSLDVTYHYVDKSTVRGRRYTKRAGAQCTPRRVQHRTLSEHTCDLDIANCCLTILRQLIDKMEPTPGLPTHLRSVLDRCVEDREAFARDCLDMSTTEAKALINVIFNGGAPSAGVQNDSVQKLQSLGIYCRWLACNALPEEYDRLANDAKKERPMASTLHLFWTSVEDAIVDAWLEALCPLLPKHLSLHFDGVRIDRAAVEQNADLIQRCQKAIVDKTGFNVRIVQKTTSTIKDLIAAKTETMVSLRSMPAALLQDGNCIPCAIWHLSPKSRMEINAAFSKADRKENADAVEQGFRSYRACATMVKKDLHACLGLPASDVDNFILHFENDGKPHCLAVQYNATRDHVSVLDGATHYRLTLKNFTSCVLDGIDASTAVSFWEQSLGRDGSPGMLLDLQAGAKRAAPDKGKASHASAASSERSGPRLQQALVHSDASDSTGSDAEDAAAMLPSQCSMVDDEDKALMFSESILAKMAEEVRVYTEKLKSGDRNMKVGGKHACRLCPFRIFNKKTGLLTHVRKYHTDINQYVCSGTKQIKVILALHDHAAGLQLSVCHYLQESARLMAATVVPPPCTSRNYVDKTIRLLFKSSGPEYINVSELGKTVVARRVRNIYYDKSFAEMLFQEVLMHHVQVRATWPRLHLRAHEAGNQLSSLYPTHTRHWWPLLEDVAYSAAVQTKMNEMLDVLLENKEWLYVSVDATLKTCLKLKGQESYRAPKAARNAAPFPDATAWRRLLTARGRTGAVLLMVPLATEKAEHVVEQFQLSFSAAALAQVEYLATDQPSPKLFSMLQSICTSLKCVALDPIHLAIVYEYAHWNKRTAGSRMLRSLVRKVLAIDTSKAAEDWGVIFTGSNPTPLSQEEQCARDHIWHQSMPKAEAEAYMLSLCTDVPFYNRCEFIRGLAALCSLKPEEVGRKVTGANKEVFKILWSAAAPDRLEWLWNNLRLRHGMTVLERAFLPSGTSSNEALHAEINAWLRTANSLHRSTLLLKLRLMRYRKLVAHHVAMCFPFVRVTAEGVILSRALAKPLWSEASWLGWCDEQKDDGKGPQNKAKLPLVRAREDEASAVQAWVRKKPASKRRCIKRTPFNARRQHQIRVGGIKKKCRRRASA